LFLVNYYKIIARLQQELESIKYYDQDNFRGGMMCIYDEPLTEEATVMLLQIDKESKGLHPAKQDGRNSGVWRPIVPGFESLSEMRKQVFAEHLIECYPDITKEQLETVDHQLLMEVRKMLPSTPLKRAILIAQESERQREQLSSIPFYAHRAANYGISYWVRMCASYRACDF